MKRLALLFFVSFITIAGEVDHYFAQGKHLEDATAAVNQQASVFMQKALDKANEKFVQRMGKCHDQDLYSEIRVYFKNHVTGQMTNYIKHADHIDKIKPSKDESIFRFYNMSNAFGFNSLVLAIDDTVISPIIRLGNHYVGTDKFEHLFSRGYVYFTKHYRKGKPLSKVIKFGAKQERYILGGSSVTTAVFSFGDLAANFNGMRFWNHMLSKHPDVLGEEYGPYFKCDEDGWKKVKDIDLSVYLDDSVNEAINCSWFPSKRTARKYQAGIDAVAKDNPGVMNATCPSDRSKLERMIDKYGEYAKYLINTSDEKMNTKELPIVKMKKLFKDY
jgi:hypothetical protein